jgi:hypothetical protein
LKKAVVARYPHHTWLLDLTEIKALCGRTSFFLATIFDGFSRMPLAWRLLDTRAHTDDMTEIVDVPCRVYGKPHHDR